MSDTSESNSPTTEDSLTAACRSVVKGGRRNHEDGRGPLITVIPNDKYPKLRTEIVTNDIDCSESIDRTETSDDSKRGTEPLDYVETGMSRRSITQIYHKPPLPGMNDSYAGEDYTFGWFDKLTGVISISLFFIDHGTDINLIVTYFRLNKWIWGIGTTVVVVIPSLVVCGLGLHWYIIDYRKERSRQSRHCIWFLRFFFTVLQCGPVIR